MNIVLWGIGKRLNGVLEKGYFAKHNICGLVDSYKNIDKYGEYNVYSPEELVYIMGKIDYVVITTRYYLEICKMLVNMDVSLKKVIITDCVLDDGIYSDMFDRLKLLSKEYHDVRLNIAVKFVRINEYDNVDKEMLLGKGKYADYDIYTMDYFRYRTFEFCAREIKKNKVEGVVAEFGVFRGWFASLISDTFSDRKIYLFDTFEGFGREEGEREVQQGRCKASFLASHAKTSLELMLNNMPYLDKVEVCKGLFPASISVQAEQEKYAFVSLDVDFEESTYEGLKFFYPRLSDNGMIFLHDYHTYYLEGVREAVKRFETDNGIILKKVPLADRAGTLVIVK